MDCLHCLNGHMQPPNDGHPSYVLCSSCGAVELTYVPQEYQQPMHSVPYSLNNKNRIRAQIIAVFGGYGSGKSRATLSEFLIRALENPGGTGLFTANTMGQLKKTTLKTWFNEVCPPPLIESYNKTDMEIRLVNGFTIYCIPSDEEEKIRSINAGIIHMEEASGIKRSIYDQLLTRMRDPFVFNRAIFICSNPDLGWIKDVFVDNEKRKNPLHPEHDEYNPYIYTFIWKTELNRHLPDDYIEINSKGKPEWWIKRFLMGSFEHSDGMVYPGMASTFISSKDYLAPYQNQACDKHGIPKSWERFATLDHGIQNPTAFYLHAINPDKWEVVTYFEYYQPRRTVPEHARVIKPEIDAIPRGRLMFMVADPSTRNKTDPVEGRSVQFLYQEYDLYFAMGNNSIDAGILRVNSYIMRGKWKILVDRCPELAKEGINYKWKETSMDDDHKNLDEKPVKNKDHGMDSCFVAGTLITTGRGQIPIEQVRVGDTVLTRHGMRSVIDWGITNREAQVFTVRFSNGKSITATGNHPVWVDGKGFIPVDSLRYGDIMLTKEETLCQLKSSSGTDGFGDCIQQNGISKATPYTFIKRFGNPFTGRFQRNTTFTTKTETRRTMTSQILRQFQRSITYRSTAKKDRSISNTWNEYARWPQSGMGLKKVSNGIGNTRKSQFSNDLRLLKHWLVNNAASLLSLRLSQPSFALTSASPNGVETADLTTSRIPANTVARSLSQTGTTSGDSAPVHVVSVHTEAQRQTVYNLSVEEHPEYFANGVLVHNCRYGFMRLPDDPDLLSTLSFSPPERYTKGTKYENEYHYSLDDDVSTGEEARDWMSYV